MATERAAPRRRASARASCARDRELRWAGCPRRRELAEALARPFLRLARFLFAIARRRRRLERSDQLRRGRRHLVDREIERGLVGPRGPRGAAQLSNELK